MRYLKFIQLQINFSSGQIIIKNNDEKGMHWLLITMPDFRSTIGGTNFLEITLLDPFNNVFGIFHLNNTTLSTTAVYYTGSQQMPMKGLNIFIPYNWSLLINSGSGNTGSATLNFIVLAFDKLEELIDYMFGNGK